MKSTDNPGNAKYLLDRVIRRVDAVKGKLTYLLKNLLPQAVRRDRPLWVIVEDGKCEF